jgi:hypothetical protein
MLGIVRDNSAVGKKNQGFQISNFVLGVRGKIFTSEDFSADDHFPAPQTVLE